MTCAAGMAQSRQELYEWKWKQVLQMQTQCGGKKEPNCLPLSVKPMISFFQMTMLQTIPEDYQSPENTNIPKLTEADPPRSFLHTLPIVNEFSCGHCDLAQTILQMLQFPILPPSLSQKSSCKDFFLLFAWITCMICLLFCLLLLLICFPSCTLGLVHCLCCLGLVRDPATRHCF